MIIKKIYKILNIILEFNIKSSISISKYEEMINEYVA